MTISVACCRWSTISWIGACSISRKTHKKAGDKAPKAPSSPRPPEIGKIWHNAFHELLKDNAGEIEDVLAASAAVVTASSKRVAVEMFANQTGLVLSKAQALRLARRTGANQLAIPVNPEFDHKLMLLTDDPPKLKVGSMDFAIIAPLKPDLEKLRKEWDQWLRENKEQLAEIRRKAKADEDRLKSDVDRLLAPMTAHADRFVEFQLELAEKTLGDRAQVTTPNLASLMFLAREGDQTILLTGDGFAGDALKGLRQRGLLDANGKLHVDVLKVPHHGSEHNMTPEFAQTVTADDYIFCGNGFSTNPELVVVNILVKERKKALPQKPFTLWFNSTAALTHPNLKAHMKELEANVAGHAAAGGGKVKAKWISGSFMDVH